MKMEEILLKNTGYSGQNTCFAYKFLDKWNCKCIDTDRRAECDVSQLMGDMYACCPLYNQEELERVVLSLLEKVNKI
jgi:hypothetical protein